MREPESTALFYIYAFQKLSYSAATLGVVSSAISNLFRYEKNVPTHDALPRDTLKVARRNAHKPAGKLPISLNHLTSMARTVKPNFVSIRDYFLLLVMTKASRRKKRGFNAW